LLPLAMPLTKITIQEETIQELDVFRSNYPRLCVATERLQRDQSLHVEQHVLAQLI